MSRQPPRKSTTTIGEIALRLELQAIGMDWRTVPESLLSQLREARKWRAEQYKRRLARQPRAQQQRTEAEQISKTIERMLVKDQTLSKRRAMRLYLQSHYPEVFPDAVETWNDLSTDTQEKDIAALEKRLSRAKKNRHDN